MNELKPNKAQDLAISTLMGPVILISCPGSGKTTTLVRRIHHMIESGIDPDRILMVTFTNAAAAEMKIKYQKLFSVYAPSVHMMTIHSLCFNILRMEGIYTLDSLYSEQEKRDYFFNGLKRLSWVNDAWELSQSIMTEISIIKNNYIDIDTYIPTSCEKNTFRKIMRSYEKRKETLGKIDFDDMLLKCLELLESDVRIRDRWQDRFDYIQCDEYQDTNRIQRDILYLLSGQHRNLCVVGDDDQSIYMFRGARPEIMLEFPEDFANACSISMSTNYRSGQSIVDMASRLIAMNRHRFPKDFISERGSHGENGLSIYKKCKTHSTQMDFVMKTIKKRHAEGIPYHEMAIIFRTNKQARAPVSLLARDDLPFFTTETVSSVYDGWMFRGIAAYIRLATGTGSRDDMLYVLNRPNRFLQESAFVQCEYSTKSLLAAAGYLRKDEEWKYRAAEKSIRTWMRNFGPGTLEMTDSPELVFEKLADPLGIDYDDYLLSYAKFRNFDEKEIQEEFKNLRKEASAFDTIEEWLRYARSESIRIREAAGKKDKSGVVITTMHKAKGLEWDTVFVIDVNENVIPHKNATGSIKEVEEERRLLYVAMTRAKNALYVLCSGKESPFMKQMKAALEKEEEKRRRDELEKKLDEEIKARKADGEAYDPKEDPVAGLCVRHRNFGKGYVVSADEEKGRITVRFADKERAFMYPQAFERGFLSIAEE